MVLPPQQEYQMAKEHARHMRPNKSASQNSLAKIINKKYFHFSDNSTQRHKFEAS